LIAPPLAEGTPEVLDGMPVAAAEPEILMIEPSAMNPDGTSSELHLGIDHRAGAFMHRLGVWKDEVVAWFKTLASAAVYATLIVTFGFQVARVEGQSMAPTLADQDRLIVNKLAYRMGEPRRGDIVMLYYPLNPDKSFVKATRCALSTAACSSTTCRCRTISCRPNTGAMTTSGPR
jgi:hypothetical protein